MMDMYNIVQVMNEYLHICNFTDCGILRTKKKKQNRTVPLLNQFCNIIAILIAEIVSGS